MCSNSVTFNSATTTTTRLRISGKHIPTGQTNPVYNKNGVLLGYAGYGKVH